MWHIPRSTVRIVKRVMPAVVSIAVTKSAKSVASDLAALTSTQRGKPKHATVIPPEKIDARGMVQIGGGSGFFVEPSGYVLTNKHVIAESGAHYAVMTSEGIAYEAETIARDPVNDIAILKIDSRAAPRAIPLGDSSVLRLGEPVLAFGNVLGILKNTVSKGIVSGLSRAVTARADPEAPPQEMRGLIQTDAAINVGNSGGPLVNMRGEAIGVNAATIQGAENIGFAVPVNSAKRDLDDLKKFGRIHRPLLGLRYLTLNEDIRQKMGLPVSYGALVTREHPFDAAVIPDTPAAKAGLKEGDIVLAWNGEEITTERSIQDYLEISNVNEEVALSVLRKDKELIVRVTLIERK
ncbi:MAG: trypsin-like peptidase domain-containing protein [Candidatus Brennerbacteria bacterium]|nr:trypsin-like peptidase domain-containing protein [Candidatus Brennerbacteria bacterium]